MGRADREIHFATTADGLSIAHWSIGSGPPLIYTQNVTFNHAELEWGVPSMARLYETLARHVMVIRFDVRGGGMSDPIGDAEHAGLEGFCLDIDAVAAAIGLESFHLLGVNSMGPVVLHYAATRPEAVDHLVLCDTGPSVADMPLANYVTAQQALVVAGVGVQLSFVDWIPPDDVRGFEALFEQATNLSPEITESMIRWDVSSVLGEITAPTLVIRSRESQLTNQASTRRLVAGIGDAQMRIVEGRLAPFAADQADVVAAIAGFLGLAPTQTARSPGLRTVVFTDLVSSTELLSELGDEEGRAAFREIEELSAELGAAWDGRVVKYTGDGSLLSFESTTSALRFALALQERLQAGRLALRIGMAAGEPIQEGDDLHGAVVVQASRIADLGQSGEIIVSDSVRQLAVGKGFTFASLGEVELKGFDEPAVVWSLLAGPSD